MSDGITADFLLHTLSQDKWQRLTPKKRAGILVPLFSLYSKNSAGIGELPDLKLLIDFCVKTKQSIIQLLPMNELGSVFCPYDSVSSFALEPSYLSIGSLPGAEAVKIQEKIEKIRTDFPCSNNYVNYEVKKRKLEVLEDIFSANSNTNDKSFVKFFEENFYWLVDFALFKVLKEENEGKAWWDWEGRYKYRDPITLDNFAKKNCSKINFQMWMQWQLYKQFKGIKDYAGKNGILIKGDLPILVSRDSADVWAHPDYFKMDFVAGAPPDMYCAKGQRWGIPTYDWLKIAFDGYIYLKEKLKYAQNFYDILRIDHVVGLFRIWSIPFNEPEENHGLHGAFDPSDEHAWKDHGKTLLTTIVDNTSMLLCAEDLGVIPKSCTDTLRELGIPGNDVERWVKDWNVRHDFLPPNEYRWLSVAMLSTHDTTNWAGWWENEAGTVDEQLFIRKCNERHIDYEGIKNKLFDFNRSGHGRLRWRDDVSTVDILLWNLAKRKEEVGDFIEIYKNTFQEKERLWKQLKLSGPIREKCDKDILRAALSTTLGSKAIFCIELITDLLYLIDLFKGDSYQYRINIPGTVDPKNWSLRMPISLEDLLNSPAVEEIKQIVSLSGRI